MSLDQRSQARLLAANALVSIKIKTNCTGLSLKGIVDGATEHCIIDGPSVVADVPLVDPNDGHRGRWAESVDLRLMTAS